MYNISNLFGIVFAYTYFSKYAKDRIREKVKANQVW
jgi:hypothetical protein